MNDMMTEKKGCKDYLIISINSKWKSYFDVWILIIVGYSCIVSLFYVAFEETDNQGHRTWDVIVEVFFYADLVFTFFQEYREPHTN